jgi:hypothetical protein
MSGHPQNWGPGGGPGGVAGGGGLMERRFRIIAYDISDDRRRTRLEKIVARGDRRS